MNKLQLKIFRKKYQLTQKDLARVASVAVATVQSWENGYRNISQSALKLLEQYEKEHSTNYHSNENHNNKMNVESLLLKLRPTLNNALSILIEDIITIIEEKTNDKLMSWHKIIIENQEKINLITEMIMIKEINENSIKEDVKYKNNKKSVH